MPEIMAAGDANWLLRPSFNNIMTLYPSVPKISRLQNDEEGMVRHITMA